MISQLLLGIAHRAIIQMLFKHAMKTCVDEAENIVLLFRPI